MSATRTRASMRLRHRRHGATAPRRHGANVQIIADASRQVV
ncbi:MAG TPA: hypothetical protein VF755_00110 [Catenuloplanes sp.]